MKRPLKALVYFHISLDLTHVSRESQNQYNNNTNNNASKWNKIFKYQRKKQKKKHNQKKVSKHETFWLYTLFT